VSDKVEKQELTDEEAAVATEVSPEDVPVEARRLKWVWASAEGLEIEVDPTKTNR